MDPTIIRDRQLALDSARRPPVPDRVAYLQDLVVGRKVLDIGVVDHNSDSDRTEHWLHGRLAEVAAEIYGIDIIEDEIDRLASLGFDVGCMDVTAGELPPGRWDVVVAGELVEHLGNPGALFDAAAELLTDDGVFVLTSPNPYAPWRVYQNMRGEPYENTDHALLLSPWGVTELADRSGLVLRSFRGISAPPEGRRSRWLAKAVKRGWLPFVPDTTCESIIYEVGRLR